MIRRIALFSIVAGILLLGVPQDASAHNKDKINIKIKKSSIGTFYFNTGQSNFQQMTAVSAGYNTPSYPNYYFPYYYPYHIFNYYYPHQSQSQSQSMSGSGNQYQYQYQYMNY